MIYVFDTTSFRVLGNYFPENFPTFWENIEQLIHKEGLISVKEVYSELENQAKGHLLKWVESNKKIFLAPHQEETKIVAEIFKVKHFLQLVNIKSISKGTAVADPFLIASAKIRNACVVTEEVFKNNGAKIPNVCNHFDVTCTNVAGFMANEGWKF